MQLKKMIMETVPARFDGRDCWVMWHKINDEIIPAINELLTNTPPNEPLTLEQLREMDGEPVWAVLIDEKYKYLDGWYLVHRGSAYLARIDDWELDAEEYGVEWLAYRRPPEGET